MILSISQHRLPIIIRHSSFFHSKDLTLNQVAFYVPNEEL